MDGSFQRGTRVHAADLNRLAESASSAHLGSAGFLAVDNGFEQVPRNPRRATSATNSVLASAKVRLFACKIGTYEDAPAAFCYLPPLAAQAVRWRNVAVTAPTLGTAVNPWVRLPQASGNIWLVLTFPDGSYSRPFNSQTAAPLAWEISFDGTASATRWPHLIASVSESGRVEQFHLGPLLLGTPGISGTRTFVTASVIKSIDGVYCIVNERCRILFVDGLAINISNQPDEVVARLGACT